METGKIEEQATTFSLLTTSELKGEFLPWSLGDRGQQSFIKLKRKDEVAYLYAGVGSVLHAEVQKALMRLVNEGWSAQGEVHVTFEGDRDMLTDRFLERDAITIELGTSLLPLVDPYAGTPLLERLNVLRDEIAQALGFVIPSINVKDNLSLEPNAYLIRLRESPVTSGELYLERFLAMGSLDQLGAIKGWSMLEPTYKMNAKWIEPGEREKAEEAGCIVQGALNVLITHIDSVLVAHGKDILGLQETHDLLSRLSVSHPVVVEEFLSDAKKLRKVRKVLQNLLAENVSIKDLVTIMEIVGDNAEDLNASSLMTEHVRRGLAHQICWSLADREGIISALALSESLEKELSASLVDALGGAYLSLQKESEEQLISLVRKSLEEHEHPPVIITGPAVRIYLSGLLGSYFPHLAFLSTEEITPGVRLHAAGQVKGSLFPRGEKEARADRKPRKPRKFWNKTD
ncbi:MAG: FHIPEP family type III secretion protein [Candidatus Eremiobacteraeota bacterium]|nr:FHIPEP family type III secretion protein [Candidatus Eremiobacteraeota bacterium]